MPDVSDGTAADAGGSVREHFNAFVAEHEGGLFAGITATVTSFVLAGQAAPSDPVEQLQRLAELSENGAPAEAEFQQLKADLLPHLVPGRRTG